MSHEAIAVLLPLILFAQGIGTLLLAKCLGFIKVVDDDAYTCFAWPLVVLLMPVIVPLAFYRAWRKKKTAED